MSLLQRGERIKILFNWRKIDIVYESQIFNNSLRVLFSKKREKKSSKTFKIALVNYGTQRGPIMKLVFIFL